MNNALKVAGRICTTTPDQIKHSGGLISAEIAKTRLDNYFLATGYDRKDPKLIFGQIFGLAQLQDFMNKINDYNSANPRTEVIGVRIYNAVSTRAYLPGDDGTKDLLDVMMVPILATGQDMYRDINDKMMVIELVNNLEEDKDIILSDGRPCPNECDSSMFQ